MGTHTLGEWLFAIVSLIAVFFVISEATGLLISLGITNETILSAASVALLLILYRLVINPLYKKIFQK